MIYRKIWHIQSALFTNISTKNKIKLPQRKLTIALHLFHYGYKWFLLRKNRLRHLWMRWTKCQPMLHRRLRISPKSVISRLNLDFITVNVYSLMLCTFSTFFSRLLYCFEHLKIALPYRFQRFSHISLEFFRTQFNILNLKMIPFSKSMRRLKSLSLDRKRGMPNDIDFFHSIKHSNIK